VIFTEKIKKFTLTSFISDKNFKNSKMWRHINK